MGHFFCAVFSDSPDEKSFDRLLAPYSHYDESLKRFFPKSERKVKKEYASFRTYNPLLSFEQFLECYGYIRLGREYGQIYNPQGKYSFYTLGARLSEIPFKPGFDAIGSRRQYRKNDFDYEAPEAFLPSAYITPDGKWHDHDFSDGKRRRFTRRFMRYAKNRKNPYVSFVDCHS